MAEKSAEAPRTPAEWASRTLRVVRLAFSNEQRAHLLGEIEAAIRAALAARDAEWRQAYRTWWNGPKGDDESAAALRAMLSEEGG